MILTVTLTPALDKTVTLPSFAVNKVNRIQSLRVDPGGKGINVSKVLKSLGTSSTATGILGGTTGQFIQDSLEKLGIQCDFVFVPEDTRTNLKVIDPINHTNTDINEPGAPVSKDVLAQVYEKVIATLSCGDLVVLAGKAPQDTPDTIFADWIRSFKSKGIKVFLDADADLLVQGAKSCPTLIKPNDEELSRLLGRTFTGIPDMARAALTLTNKGIETVVVSLGADGALFVQHDKVLRGYGLPVPVVSTVGAGDSMMAAMCHGIALNEDFEKICANAMAVSAANVMCSGTQSATLESIHALIPKVRLEQMVL